MPVWDLALTRHHFRIILACDEAPDCLCDLDRCQDGTCRTQDQTGHVQDERWHQLRADIYLFIYYLLI